jgi:hypothetical protein
MIRTNYIYIDFENVHETDLDRIANRPVKVRLILGKRHNKLPVSLVKLIHKYAGQVSLIETVLDGSNALDFILACELGAEAVLDPNGYFHVLSKDKGFDALIEHLKSKDIHAARHAAFNEILPLMNLEERVKLLGDHYEKHQVNRPRNKKTLESQINAVFGKTLSPEKVEETVQGLIAKKIISLSEKGAVTYKT